jgi:hypothetical protein
LIFFLKQALFLASCNLASHHSYYLEEITTSQKINFEFCTIV